MFSFLTSQKTNSILTAVMVAAAMLGSASAAQAQGFQFATPGYVPSTIHTFDATQPIFNANINNAIRYQGDWQDSHKSVKKHEKLASKKRHWFGKLAKRSHDSQLSASGMNDAKEIE